MNEKRPCRCGKITLESDEAVVLNDYQHEPFSREDGFCGPVLQHDLRDLHIALAAAEAERDRLRDACELALAALIVGCGSVHREPAILACRAAVRALAPDTSKEGRKP